MASKSPKSSKPLSARQKQVGWIVAGGGLCLLLVALYSLFDTYAGPSQIKDPPQATINPVFDAAQNPDRRQADAAFPLKRLEGKWVAEAGTYLVSAVFDKGAYQIIAYQPLDPSQRFYARGVYRVEEYLLILDPRADFGKPEQMGVNYRLITRKPFAVLTHPSDLVMRWQPGPPDPKYGASQYVYPLLSWVPGQELVFKKQD